MMIEKMLVLSLTKADAIELWRFLSLATPSKFSTRGRPVDWERMGELRTELAHNLFPEDDSQ